MKEKCYRYVPSSKEGVQCKFVTRKLSKRCEDKLERLHKRYHTKLCNETEKTNCKNEPEEKVKADITVLNECIKRRKAFVDESVHPDCHDSRHAKALSFMHYRKLECESRLLLLKSFEDIGKYRISPLLFGKYELYEDFVKRLAYREGAEVTEYMFGKIYFVNFKLSNGDKYVASSDKNKEDAYLNLIKVISHLHWDNREDQRSLRAMRYLKNRIQRF
jgi:hypothetical protein